MAGTDGAKLLSDLSGVSRADVLSIWEEVKANRAKLDACARHRFLPVPVKMGDKVTCVVCGGILSLSALDSYVRGYKASGGNPDDIWPGYFKEKA